MATIMQVIRPGDELREIVCTTMEDWEMISRHESNTVIVDKEPGFEVGAMIEIAGGENGQSASLNRIVKGIEKDADQNWIITLNAKGEKIKKVSILTIRLNHEEVKQLEAFKKVTGKKTASEAIKFMIKEFPRWNEVMKENLQESKQQRIKYNKLLKANTNFMLAFQEIVNIVNEEG